jgi:hypothetical protein
MSAGIRSTRVAGPAADLGARGSGTSIPRVTGALIGLALVLSVLIPGIASAAVRNWSLTHSPSSVSGGPAAVHVTATNTGGDGGGDAIGCVTVLVPNSAFTVTGVVIDTVSDSDAWTATYFVGASDTVVTLYSNSGGQNRLHQAEWVAATVNFTGTGSDGTFTWTGNAFNKEDCTDDFGMPRALSVTIGGAAVTPTPSASAAPTPTQAPSTSTPAPTAAPTAVPTAAPTPAPSATRAESGAPSPTPPASSATRAESAAPTPTPPASSATRAESGAPAPTPPAPSVIRDESAAQMPNQPAQGSPSATPVPAVAIPAGGPLTVGQAATAEGIEVGFETLGSLLSFGWFIPGLAFGVPGLLFVLAVGVQVFGALAWLPAVRRGLGSFGFRRRRKRVGVPA